MAVFKSLDCESIIIVLNMGIIIHQWSPNGKTKAAAAAIAKEVRRLRVWYTDKYS